MKKIAPILIVIGLITLVFVFYKQARPPISTEDRNSIVNQAPALKKIETPVPPQALFEARIKGNSIFVEIADSPEERTLGLSNRSSLGPDNGLFFIFETPDFYGFWMKDMNFPIDILWFNRNWKIVDIQENVSPKSFPATLYPKEESLFVLEVNSGFVKEKGIKIGDELVFSRS